MDLKKLDGYNLRRLVEETGLTHEQVALRAKISKGTFSAIVTGHRGMGRDVRQKLFNTFDLPPGYFERPIPDAGDESHLVREEAVCYEKAKPEIKELLQKIRQIYRSKDETAIKLLTDNVNFLRKSVKKQKKEPDDRI